MLGVTFAFHNVSRHAVKVGLAAWDVQLVVKAADSTRYDTGRLVSPTIPYIPPTELPPGRTRALGGIGSLLRVRWSGPLRITPSCEGTQLPVLRIGVTSPGPPPSEEAAVADVVVASGHLLDQCRPQQAGVPVRGQIDAPDWSAPPLDARCSVSIHHEKGFWVAQALVVSPPDLDHVHVTQPYEQVPSFGPDQLHSGKRGNAEAIGWEFVVTKDGATSVDSTEADATKSADRMATDWSWSSSGALKTGDSHCGGSGNGGAGARGPFVEFVTVCNP